MAKWSPSRARRIRCRNARLTVVDRFGRSDSESTAFRALSLVIPGYSWLDSGNSCQCGAYLWLHSQDGSRVTGILRFFGPSVSPVDTPVTGTVAASGEVQLMFPDSDVLLVGTLTLPSAHLDDASNRMTLTFVGGPRHGTSLALRLWTN